MRLSDAIISQLRLGPGISSEIYTKLEGKDFTRSACKTALHRLIVRGDVKKAKLAFSHNDSLVSIDGSFNNPALLKQLVEKGFYGRPTLVNLLRCLQSSHPVINRFEIAQIAALKIGQTPQFAWTEANDLIEALNEIGAIKLVDNDPHNPIYVGDKELLRRAGLAFSGTNISISHSAMIKKTKYNLLESLNKWLAYNGFVSANGSTFISANKPAISFSHTPFDYLGFSYLNGIVHRVPKLKPRPFVGDVLPNTICKLAYAQSFKTRIAESYGGSKQVPVGFIMAKGFDHDALIFMKKEGLLPWCVDQIFGKNTAEAINKILTITENLVRQQDINPTLFAEAFEGFENFGGIFGNLKGSLFEILIGYYAAKKGYEGIQLGLKIPSEELGKGNDLDLDVLGKNNKEAVFFECKGISKESEVDPAEVRKHFQVRTPLARKVLLGEKLAPPKNFRSIIVTTGKFADETSKEIAGEVIKPREDTKFELWDRRYLLNELKSDGHTQLVEIIERYF